MAYFNFTRQMDAGNMFSDRYHCNEYYARCVSKTKGREFYTVQIEIPDWWFVDRTTTFEQFIHEVKTYLFVTGRIETIEESPVPTNMNSIPFNEENYKKILAELDFKIKKDALLIKVREFLPYSEEEMYEILGIFSDIKIAKAEILENRMKGYIPYLSYVQEINLNSLIL